MIVIDKTIDAEGLDDLFRNLGKKVLLYQEKYQKTRKNVLRNPSRAMDTTANVATAAACRNCKTVMSTLPELIPFYKTGKFLYLGKFV